MVNKRFKRFFHLCFFLSTLFIKSSIFGLSIDMSPEQVVQQNLEAYNRSDIEAFMASFSPDAAIYNFAEQTPSTVGLEAVRKRYQDLFQQSPNLHSTILKRIVFDNKVIDHESITGRLGSENTLEIIMIYEVKEDKICKMTVIRK
jgi:hypothetical protein